MINDMLRYWIIITISAIIMACQKKDVKLTEEHLVNAVAFAAYPSEPRYNDTYGSSKEIFIIKAEPESEVIRITFSRNWEEQPVWIDNGKSLVFTRCIGRVGSPTSKWYLYKKNLLNGREKKLFEVDLGIEIKSSEDLYLLEYGGFNPALYYLNRDSGSLTKIFTPKDIGISILSPGSGVWDFSVDKRETKFALVIAEGIRVKGKKLAKEWDKCREIAIVNLDGTNLQILTNDTFPDFSSAISPDCKSIAFESERDGNRDIYLMEIATKELERLTNHPSRDYSPTWSPDGKKIAFISERDGFSHIWVINADGTGLYQLTKGEFHVCSGISWSPR